MWSAFVDTKVQITKLVCIQFGFWNEQFDMFTSFRE